MDPKSDLPCTRIETTSSVGLKCKQKHYLLLGVVYPFDNHRKSKISSKKKKKKKKNVHTKNKFVFFKITNLQSKKMILDYIYSFFSENDLLNTNKIRILCIAITITKRAGKQQQNFFFYNTKYTLYPERYSHCYHQSIMFMNSMYIYTSILKATFHPNVNNLCCVVNLVLSLGVPF